MKKDIDSTKNNSNNDWRIAIGEMSNRYCYHNHYYHDNHYNYYYSLRKDIIDKCTREEM